MTTMHKTVRPDIRKMTTRERLAAVAEGWMPEREARVTARRALEEIERLEHDLMENARQALAHARDHGALRHRLLLLEERLPAKVQELVAALMATT